ncbi:histidine phosphatase superfamily [Fimicolochytrium jonesii]|uniref:histidine phosphatase superfamily n=1 Tax=Fimicolochytrium jonesii TaxID=1396493 RepID=UPI0022FE63AC|nr:histidine phosphatase superfamily [Fimicolochytrium jonesii]KAI8815775.1 histidine phosphatase superfamily [Fimicolochytrium jonesii]
MPPPPRPLTIHILRHGTRQDFLTPNWTSPTNLPKDPPIAPIGHHQAQEVSAHLLGQSPHSRSPPPITHIFSSPFTRCIQTVAPYARARDLRVKIEDGLGEWFNEANSILPAAADTLPSNHTEAKPCPRAPTVAELEALFPGLVDLGYEMRMRGTRWESKAEVHERLRVVLGRIIGFVEGEEDQKGGGEGGETHILLVTHAAAQIALVRALVGDERRKVTCGVATLSRFRRRIQQTTAAGVGGGKTSTSTSTSTNTNTNANANANANEDSGIDPSEWVMEADGDARHLSGGLQYNWAFAE